MISLKNNRQKNPTQFTPKKNHTKMEPPIFHCNLCHHYGHFFTLCTHSFGTASDAQGAPHTALPKLQITIFTNCLFHHQKLPAIEAKVFFSNFFFRWLYISSPTMSVCVWVSPNFPPMHKRDILTVAPSFSHIFPIILATLSTWISARYHEPQITELHKNCSLAQIFSLKITFLMTFVVYAVLLTSQS